MIYFEGLDSIIESIYLSDSLSNRPADSDLFVNPENIRYLVGKTVIISACDYPDENIIRLMENNNHIISRIYCDVPGVEFRPYILKLCFNLMWNGQVVEKFTDYEDLFDNEAYRLDLDTYTLYFPKLNLPVDSEYFIDKKKNLTGLGWAMQQVGMNIKHDTPYCNLDLIKTGKVIC